MSSASFPTRQAAFHTTRWSVVLGARENSSHDGRLCLETLCQQYWPPLYAYVRHRGHPPHDAQDLTQGFFARLLEKDWLLAVDQERGRFRSFLLMALKRFLANERDHAQALKRGGGAHVISLDANEAEGLYAGHDLATLPADSLFERRWALAVLETVMQRLRGEYEALGKTSEYESLRPCLTAERGDIAYDSLAKELGVEPASARSSVHRLRKRFREMFRDEISSTVADPADVEDEMRAVITALSQG